MEYRKLDAQTQGSLTKAMQIFSKAKQIPIKWGHSLKWEKVEKKGMWNKIFPEYKMKTTAEIPYVFEFNSREEARQALIKANAFANVAKAEKGKYWVIGPVRVQGSPEKINEMEKIYGEITKEIGILKLRIDHGHRLNGKCGLCPPRVRIGALKSKLA